MPVNNYGERIYIGMAKQYIKNYYDLYEKAVALIPEDEKYDALREFLKAERQVMSGVYGKDRIEAILNQKDCAGLRYALAMNKGTITLVLCGVKTDGSPTFNADEDEGSTVLDNLDEWRQRRTGDPSENRNDPMIIEVHRSGKTAQELNEYLNL